MTEKEFFFQLQNLSIAQLNTVHNSLLLRIEQQLAIRKKVVVAAQEFAKNKPNTRTVQSKSLPKPPQYNISIGDIADKLELDISNLMREISKR